ncbi:molybdopterin-binding protein [Myxococcota bacterium]|nr:molybdopterin-binding protein [Myxococcota bacterium]
MSTAGIIVIGNEVLSGKVDEENARFAIRELRDLGVAVMRVSIIRDDVDLIAREVREMSDAYTWVFTSGGVGSTHDDVTMEGVARAFGVPLETDARMAALIAEHYGERLNDAAKRMAIVPRGTELVGYGRTPYPIVRVKNVHVLPGVPTFFRMKLEALRDDLRASPIVLKQLFVRVGETRIAERMTDVQRAFPDVEIGSYPRYDLEEYRVKITFESRDAARVDAAVAALVARFEDGWVVRVE